MAEESSRNSNRAYITTIGGPGLHETGAASPALGVELFATGNTPALNVRKGIAYQIRKLPLSRSSTDYIGDPPYAPEVFSLQRPQTEALVTDVNLSAADRQKIETGGYGLVLWGSIEYTTFDKIHHTRFCYVMRPNLKQEQRRCPVHNDAD